MKRLLLLWCLLSSMVLPLAQSQATVSTTSPRNDYIGTGALATYDYTFRIFAATDLRVTTRNTSGVETALTYPTDYTVTGVNGTNGGTITLTAGALTTDYILTIRFDRTPQQTTDLRNQGSFFAETHENKFDELTRYIQALNDVSDRSIRIPETEDPADFDMSLPTTTERAGKFLAFGADGNPIATSSSITSAPVTSFISTLLDDTTAAEARTTLGVPSVAEATTPADNIFRVTGSSDATKKVALEVDGLTTATTRAVTIQDKSGTLALTSEFDYANLAGSAGRMPLPPMFIQGMTFANNAGDATNDIDIAAGKARDASDAHNIILSALTKRLDAAWAVGTNQGGLDAGSIGNSDYYIWAIKRSDTGVADVLFSLSSTAPTMPANYDVKRLIGWFKRVGGTIVAFHTYETEGGGIELTWDVPTLEIDLAGTLGTARRTDPVKVPLNFSVTAHLSVLLSDDIANFVWIYCPDQTDTAPSTTSAPLANIAVQAALSHAAQLKIRTSATGTIAARATSAALNNYRVSTMGFTWARRN